MKRLGKFDFVKVIEALISYLSDENPLIRAEAARALDRIDSETKYDLLLPLLESKDRFLLLYAIQSLGKGEQVNAVLTLIDQLGNDNPEVVYKTVDALRLIGDPRAEEHIMKCLTHREEKIRYAAAFYCGSRKIELSGSRLAVLLAEKNSELRLVAVWALGQLNDMTSLSKLTTLLDHETDENVRNEAFRILHRKNLFSVLEHREQLQVCNFDEMNNVKCISDWYLTYILKQKEITKADICLFVEGSYPYVSGGVSSWVHDILKYFQDLTFSIVHISTSSSELKGFKYEIPKNVIYLQELSIYDIPDRIPSRYNRHLKKVLDLLYGFLTTLDSRSEADLAGLYRELGMPDKLDISLGELLFSYEAWEFINKIYQKYLSDLPFLEYNWSYRSILLPLYNVIKSRMPPARIFYSALTGYAGLASVLAKVEHGGSMMLTEHGIYHRERMLEINRSGWIYEKEDDGYVAREVATGLKQVWINMYYALSALAYRFSDSITTLYGDNAAMQREAGADPAKIRIIPNGIDTGLFGSIRDGLTWPETFTVALIGRVVAIKDIKTFIRAARIVTDHLHESVSFAILGPADEEIEYANECFALTRMLNLEEKLTCTGNVDLKEYLKKIDLVVLTSVSEGQPLSLMEAMAAGIPCVATNVGACRELLYGHDEEDMKLGPCGIITSVHSAFETARAIMTILEDPDHYRRMAETGKERIARYYERKNVFELYRKEFDRLFEKGRDPVPAEDLKGK